MPLVSIHGDAVRAHVGGVITTVELCHLSLVDTTVHRTGHRQRDGDFNMTPEYSHCRMTL